MTDLKKMGSVKEVGSVASKEKGNTDRCFDTKKQSFANQTSLERLSKEIKASLPEKESRLLAEDMGSARRKGQQDFVVKDGKFKKQLAREADLARQIQGQGRDAGKDARNLEKMAGDLDRSAMEGVVRREVGELSNIARELSGIAGKASRHLNEVSGKDRTLSVRKDSTVFRESSAMGNEKEGQDKSLFEPVKSKDIYDNSGRQYGRMNYVTESGSIHITQTNKDALQKKGAHVTTQHGDESYHDYYDEDGNYKYSDY